VNQLLIHSQKLEHEVTRNRLLIIYINNKNIKTSLPQFLTNQNFWACTFTTCTPSSYTPLSHTAAA